MAYIIARKLEKRNHTIIRGVYRSSRSTKLSSSSARKGGMGGRGERQTHQGVASRVCHNSRASLLAYLGGGGPGIIDPVYHGPRSSLLANWGRETKEPKLAGLIGRVYHCLQTGKGGARNHRSRKSQLASIIAHLLKGGGEHVIVAHVRHGSRASSLSRVVARKLGRGGRPGNPGSRATKLACIIARILWEGGRGPNNCCSRVSQLACIFARKLGGGPGNHSSRVS